MLCGPSSDRELEIFSQVTGTAKLKKVQISYLWKHKEVPFLLLKTFMSIRCCFLWVHFPQDSFKWQTDLCAAPQGLHTRVSSRINWWGSLFILSFWKYHLSIPIIFWNVDINPADSPMRRFCYLFSPLRSVEPVLLCVFSITNMNWSVNEDASAVPDVGYTQLLASLPLYILNLWSLRRWKLMGYVTYYLPLPPVHQTVQGVWL